MLGLGLAVGGGGATEQAKTIEAEDGAAEEQEAAVGALGEEAQVAMESMNSQTSSAEGCTYPRSAGSDLITVNIATIQSPFLPPTPR